MNQASHLPVPPRHYWQGEPMLTRVADGVWVRQSEWVWTNTIVVQAEAGLILAQARGQ